MGTPDPICAYSLEVQILHTMASSQILISRFAGFVEYEWSLFLGKTHAFDCLEFHLSTIHAYMLIIVGSNFYEQCISNVCMILI